MQRCAACGEVFDIVSIRARHECRAMLAFPPGPLLPDHEFQSAPGTSAGRCMHRDEERYLHWVVSIRARHECRAMRW